MKHPKDCRNEPLQASILQKLVTYMIRKQYLYTVMHVCIRYLRYTNGYLMS